MVVAIKVIDKKNMGEEDLADIMNEVEMLQKMDHPNIVGYYETYDDARYLYLIMENCPNGELFDSIEKFTHQGRAYTEKDAAEVIRTCLQALQHCHSQNIVHRDIKPENIMFGTDGKVRLVDFGLAKQTYRRMSTLAGTPYFMAPEVLDQNYTSKCDIWSLGCILYMIVCGCLPFEGKSR